MAYIWVVNIFGAEGWESLRYQGLFGVVGVGNGCAVSLTVVNLGGRLGHTGLLPRDVVMNSVPSAGRIKAGCWGSSASPSETGSRLLSGRESPWPGAAVSAWTRNTQTQHPCGLAAGVCQWRAIGAGVGAWRAAWARTRLDGRRGGLRLGAASLPMDACGQDGDWRGTGRLP